MTFFESLKKYSSGEISYRELKDSDDDGFVYDVRDNKESPNKSIIILRFTEDEFFSLFSSEFFSDNYNNQYYIRVALNHRYYDNVFIDSYWGDEEWKEGYILATIDEENKKLLIDILKLIAPSYIKDVTDTNNYGADYSSIANLLSSNFERYCNDITYEYASLYDDTLVKGMRDFILKEFCDPFRGDMIIESSCGTQYYTSVRNLIYLYTLYGDENDCLEILLKKIIGKNSKDYDYDLGEDYYDYYDNRNWDNESFQRVVKSKFESILEDILDNFEPETLKKNSEIYDYLSSKNIEFDKYYKLPTEKFFGENKNIRYMISEVKDGKIFIKFDFRKSFSLTLEQFKNFLYHPDLFGIEN
jgi:hypothetical protein